ncbi:MAG: hypothetical protein IPN29_11550 [Saprospiraceae bacterium]|nr:hypothetical protein [Saprospiraceae bacterium]
MSEVKPPKTTQKMSKGKVIDDMQVKFFLNFGAKVRDVAKSKGVTYQELADKLKITKNGLANRLIKPHYGTIYDMIETCIELNHDFLSDALAHIKKAGVPVDTLPAAAENRLLKEQIEKLEDELDRYRKIVDKFTSI